ncbi:MAG: helix-turn-helix domain-containing protein [Pseudomonadota bacterium]
MSEHHVAEARRLSRTRAAIIDAFRALALEQRYAAIRVADIISHAGVGKSTFYEHFRGKDDVLVSAMQPVLLALATAASGRAARSYVRPAIAHLWDRRSVARPIIESAGAGILQRSLADAIATHGGGLEDAQDARLVAVGIAAAQLAMLRYWLSGHAVATIDAMTDRLIACARLRGSDPPS